MNDLKFLEEFLKKYREISSQYSIEKIESKEFNFFNLINQIYGIGETKHSRFIAFLLDPNADHGKEKLFLNEFLKIINIAVIEDSIWTVSAEKNNIDILLKCENPVKSTIIIENKSNWAVDQKNQLYRYWYREIFNSLKSYQNPKDVLNENERIIYLAPNEHKIYTSDSIEKPTELKCELDTLCDENITLLYFCSHINNWLHECLNKLNDSEDSRMKFFIEDYLGFWQETNFKNELYMKEIENYFTEKRQDWINFAESSKFITQLKEQWLENFISQFRQAKYEDWKFESFKTGSGSLSKDDFRWFINLHNDFCFVYESTIGLTIWKENFGLSKHKFRSKFEKSFQRFTFMSDDSNYIMKYNDENFIFNNEDDFAWNAGNGKLAERISLILSKFLTPEIKELFDEIDEK